MLAGRALLRAGNVIAAGRFSGALRPIIGAELTSLGDNDLFVVKLTSAGVPSWAASFGGPGDDVAVSVAVDREGTSFIAGIFGGTLRAGSVPVMSAGLQDGFLLALDSLAVVKWVRRVGGPEYDSGQDVAVDSQGNAYLAGSFNPGADLAGVALPSAGRSDIYLARFDGRGNLIWNKTFGASLLDSANRVIVDADDTVWMTGNFAGTVNFGGEPLIAVGAQTPFRARFAATGAHRFSATGLSQGFAVDARGSMLEAGGFSGSLALGGSDLVSAGGEDTFMAKFATPERVAAP